jgi:SAM-dependent methyltransferase
MNAPLDAGATPIASGHYWRSIFLRNPDFCSWQTPKQQRVRDAVRACLSEPAGLVRVLDFGIGSMELYRSLGDDVMRRIELTGISESPQHDAADPLFARYPIDIAIGPGLSPLALVPAQSQDRVVCSYVFDYLGDEMRSEALQAFARVMAEGAKLLLILHHPRGRRADKFRRSQPYWPVARAIYEQLLTRRYAEAAALLKDGKTLLAAFANDDRYRRYLASYLKTAERFLSAFCLDGHLACAVPDAAWLDCERSVGAIDREQAMTCQALRPIEHPASDLAMPRELTLCSVVTHEDPTDGTPIAHVLTAVRARP